MTMVIMRVIIITATIITIKNRYQGNASSHTSSTDDLFTH